MVARNGVDIGNLFETILASGFLGECDEGYFNLFKCAFPNATVTRNPREKEKRSDTSKPAYSSFGFWLPHGLDGGKEAFARQLRGCKQRFNAIEAAYRQVEGIPKEKLWLEQEQAEVLEQNENLLPGVNNDIPEAPGICLTPESDASGMYLTPDSMISEER